MARPERHDCDYFPFYSKDGKTLFILESKYECKGTGFFTNVMRFLTLTHDHHICILDDSDKLYFFAKTKCDVESGTDMLNMMSKTGKIDDILWVNAGVIVSEALLESLSDAYRRRSNDMITIKEIRSKYGLSEVNDYKNVLNSDKNGLNSDKKPQRKGKERKGKERKGNKPCPYQKIIDFYHTNLPELPKVISLTDTLKKRINARWKEHNDLEWWDWYFKGITECPFLLGKVKDWSANFHWLTGPQNITKILSGAYIDKKKMREQSAKERFINGS